MNTQNFRELTENLFIQNPEINGVALVGSDGRILFHLWNNYVDPDKIGALGAALLGLGKKTIQIINDGIFLQVILQSTQGMLAVYSAGEQAVLVVNTNGQCNLGMLNISCRDVAHQIEIELGIE